MRKIAVVTGTRAEYGLLKPLIQAIKEEPSFCLQLIVTGMHLDPLYGDTYLEIVKDGFTIEKKIDCKLIDDSSESITKSIGTGLIGFADALKDLTPDLMVVLGDRSEILAAATAGMIKGIPIAHLHGGEVTEGAYDDAIRHAITKMSYFHFTSTEVYRKRVIQLGEAPNRVFNVGAIGIDSIKKLKLYSKAQFEESINFKLNRKNILVTFHPVTLEKRTAKTQFNELLISLDKLDNVTLIFTKPNSDKDGRIIIEMIDDYVSKNQLKSVAFASLGQLRYLSAIQFMDVVIGNSSSGIYEVPILKKPTINIGDRQKGRLMPKSVINCKPTNEDISNALEIAISKAFKDKINFQENIFGEGQTTLKIMNILKTFPVNSIKKSFFDL